ncbi:MAG: Rieske (2Fe-2S) protein [Actinomycetota bacterium]|nr:Rieske (2Fe-2S) protein [Actinomycetota bacterium]
MTLAQALDKLAEAIEHAQALDGPADAGAGALRRILPRGKLGDLLSGTPIGHPLHPVLVSIPIGSWTAATYLDLTCGDARTAQTLIGLGNLVALPTALTGANDWLTTSGAERRLGFAHAALNYAALGLYGTSWVSRRRGRRVRGAAFALAGAAVLGAAGWLGGHLAYGLGVGVDTTAYQQLPAEWTEVAAEADVPAGRAISVDVDGVHVLLARDAGAVVAIADRCTHRGGPLHDGELSNGCITCPWHDSQFSVTDGSVVRGPATRPQARLDTRVAGDRVEVRRAEEHRSLRTSPVGS